MKSLFVFNSCLKKCCYPKKCCTHKNVVYRLSCKTCEQEGQSSIYIGETKRPVRLRFNEHIRDAQNATEGTPMGEHFKQRHSATDLDPVPLQIKIMHRARDHPDRKIAESLLIRTHRPDLNANMTSWPIL